MPISERRLNECNVMQTQFKQTDTSVNVRNSKDKMQSVVVYKYNCKRCQFISLEFANLESSPLSLHSSTKVNFFVLFVRDEFDRN